MAKDYNQFFQTESIPNKEAKFNLFYFQNHLISWISASSQYFMERDYINAFESLTIVYIDISGFLNPKEIEATDKIFTKAREAVWQFYDPKNLSGNNGKQLKNLRPTECYFALLEFRKQLMLLMSKYQLLIQTVKKDISGAGSA